MLPRTVLCRSQRVDRDVATICVVSRRRCHGYRGILQLRGLYFVLTGGCRRSMASSRGNWLEQLGSPVVGR